MYAVVFGVSGPGRTVTGMFPKGMFSTSPEGMKLEAQGRIDRVFREAERNRTVFSLGLAKKVVRLQPDIGFPVNPH